jgi:hypothetical protein
MLTFRVIQISQEEELLFPEKYENKFSIGLSSRTYNTISLPISTNIFGDEMGMERNSQANACRQ